MGTSTILPINAQMGIGLDNLLYQGCRVIDGGVPWLCGKLPGIGKSCTVGKYSAAGDWTLVLAQASCAERDGGVLDACFNCIPHFPQNAALLGL
jgi:hypothetical protein